MHRGLKSREDDDEAARILTFGAERVRRGHAVYINMYASPPLIQSLFGVECSLVKDKFLVQRTKRLSIMYVFSAAKVNEIFTLSLECCTRTIKQGFRFQLSGKIEFCVSDGIICSGYIIDETSSHFQVFCFDNRIINIRRPKFNMVTQFLMDGEHISYKLDNFNIYSGLVGTGFEFPQVTMIYPVRIQITKNADMNLKILGKYFVTTPNNDIDEVKSVCKCYLFYII